MKVKSMLFSSLKFLLFVATFALLTQTINAEENGTDVNDTITATASLLRGYYTLGHPVPLEIAVTNHGQEPVYIDVDEFGYLGLGVTVEDVNGTEVEHGPIPSPPAPPRHWWITVDGKKIFTVPVIEIASGQTTKLTIQDALKLYHDYLHEGIYYLKPRELEVIHEVDSIIIREDQEHKLWIEPSTVISRARYETNQVEITLRQEKIIYVDDDSIGANDGSSWQNAYTFLQDALYDAETSEKPVEIRVAQGIYKPDHGIAVTLGEWRVSFHLKNGVTIKGGYAGFSAPDPNSRDVGEYETILSGDLNGNDVYVNDPDYLLYERTRAENSWTVVEGSNTDSTAVLDGLTIAGGDFTVITFSLSGDPVGGAGMLISSGSPTLIDCTFTDNVTNNIGGGLLIYDDSNPTMLNCKFTRNYAESGGGGIFSSQSSPTLINCTFYNNYARRKGGAMFNFRSNLELTNCTFTGNSIPDIPTGLNEGGGAMRNSDSNLVLNNCAFNGNTASYGAGICNENNSSLILQNCTFRANLAEISGGGMFTTDSNDIRLIDCIFSGNSAKHSGGGISTGKSNTILVNCIFIGNKAPGLSTDTWSYPWYGHGGGISINGNPTIINCTFRDNWAKNGGGIYSSGGPNRGGPKLIECSFINNSAENYGGGICNYFGSDDFTVTNCTFSRNSAELGGGICLDFRARMKMTNCTFSDNFASFGNTLACDPNFPPFPGNIEVKNCILWDGDNAIFDPEPYPLSSAITYSNVQGGWPGEGNIDADPCFADPGYWDPNRMSDDPNAVWIDGDYHLKSQAGRWDPNSQSWVLDDVTSPCIDAGDPNNPVGDEPVPNGGIVNMGAYGGTLEASLSIQQPLPLIGQASNPNPLDGAISVSPDVILSWSPGEDAVAHDVYFGFTPSPGFVCNQTETDFNPGQLYPQGMLPSQARCFWRIDEIDSQGNITTGDIWRFQVHEYKGRLCFTGQTPVCINDSFIPISKVNIGQSINGVNRIEEVQEHEGTYTLYDILLESGNSINVAENHIFMIESGKWLSLHNALLKTLSGTPEYHQVVRKYS